MDQFDRYLHGRWIDAPLRPSDVLWERRHFCALSHHALTSIRISPSAEDEIVAQTLRATLEELDHLRAEVVRLAGLTATPYLGGER